MSADGSDDGRTSHAPDPDGAAHDSTRRVARADPLDLTFQAGDRTRPWPHSSPDPTATKTIRKRYAAEAYRRFRALKGVIREAVIDRRVFGDVTPGPGAAPPEPPGTAGRDTGQGYPIGPPGDPERFPDFDTCVDTLVDSGMDDENARRVCGTWQHRVEGEAATRVPAAYQTEFDPPDLGEFDLPSDADTIDAFMDWLDEQVERGILETSSVPGRETAVSDTWQTTYLRTAYERGVNHADAALVDAGVIPPAATIEAVFRAPQHADAVGSVFTRVFRELDGVTEAMSQNISRTLADGLAQGWNPRKTARELNDRVDAIGLTRARTIARTETVRAHNIGALTRYADMGDRIDGVTALVEFTTAGDERVCPECAALEGMTISVDNAWNVIPVHANCRCAWLPVPSAT
jgi:SPP1 gp7 family putative phage head morphogenesis protein